MRVVPAPRVPRRRYVLAAVAAASIISFVAAISVAAQEPVNPNPDAVWVGGSGGAAKYAATDGSLLLQLAGRDDVRALAVDRRRGSVWLTDGRVIEYWEADGTRLWSRPVPDRHRDDDDEDDEDDEDKRRSNRIHLFADAETGGAWLLRRHAAARFGADGERQARVDLRRTVRAAGFDGERGRLWVGTSRSIRAYDREGRAVAELDGVRPSRVRAIAYGLGGDAADALWLATSQELLRYDAESLDRQLRLRLRKLRHLAADGAGGVWAAADKRLRYLDASGGIQLDMRRPLDRDRIIDLAANPADRSVWVAGDDELVRVRANGVAAARIDLPRRGVPGRVAALGLFADVHAPALEWIAPADEALLADAAPALRLAHEDHGSGADVDSLQIEVGGQPLAIDCQPAESSGEAACTLSALLDQGTNILSATIADHAGNLSEPAERLLVIDTIAPAISFNPPVDGTWTNADTVTLAGQLSEAADLRINGTTVVLTLDHAFAHAVALAADGSHGIEIDAADRAGNRTARTLVVHRDTVAPDVVDADRISFEPEAVDGTTRITGEDGTVEPHAEVVITNTRTGETFVVQADENGAFVASVAGRQSDDYQITVRDRAGNESEASEVTGETVPPDPATVAPPLPETGIPPMADQVAFLYSGSAPIQQGVAPGTIEARRVSVLKGEVRSRNGEPLAGAKIRVLNHPELGHSFTQADGDFDLAVNGGGVLTVVYEKDGYLPVQRSVETQWNGWYHAEDVVMIPLDDKVTTIDLTDDSQAFQAARGSVVEDSDGTRQATVLFPASTTAEITLPDGTKKQLSQLDVRATEYTVGDNGPAAMPGELPPQSAYTYAVALTIDQALEQGIKVAGKDVTFNQSVPVYIDNFLDFPTGEPVPVGYYDDDAAAWIPHDDGRIIEILAIEDGRAVLDVTGNGETATADDLAALNLTDAERARLAELYEVGDSLWRYTPTTCRTGIATGHSAPRMMPRRPRCWRLRPSSRSTTSRRTQTSKTATRAASSARRSSRSENRSTLPARHTACTTRATARPALPTTGSPSRSPTTTCRPRCAR